MNKRVNKVTGWVLALGVVAITGKAMAQSETDMWRLLPDLCTTLAWDHRYVSEGRDNLDGDSLAGATFETGIGNMTLGLWYADSPEQSYREFNAYTVYGMEWRDIEGYLAYNHLRFLADEEYDNEIGTGIAYNALPLYLSFGLDATWSFEAEGAFIETSLSGEYQVHEKLMLRPLAALGFNAGYVAEGHDGINHGAVQLEAAIPLSKHIELTSYIAGTWAIDADAERYPDDSLLKDFVYGGFALQLTR